MESSQLIAIARIGFKYPASATPTRIMPELKFLKLALQCAEQCEPVATAFCVGCVITVPCPIPSSDPIVLATGYSRELHGNTHAEANALGKARLLTPLQVSSLLYREETLVDPGHLPAIPTIGDLLAQADIYTTMEPCSVRLSGLAPCADALIEARVKRCLIGVGEPADFVQCEGARKLESAGIEVVWMRELENECLEVARKGHPSNQWLGLSALIRLIKLIFYTSQIY